MRWCVFLIFKKKKKKKKKERKNRKSFAFNVNCLLSRKFARNAKNSRLWHFMQIVSFVWNTKYYFLGKIRKYTYFNMSSADPPPPPPPHSILRVKIYEPVHNIAYKMACAPTKDTDHPANPRSLIRVFTVRYMDSQGPKASSCGQRRLCTHTISLEMLCPDSYMRRAKMQTRRKYMSK